MTSPKNLLLWEKWRPKSIEDCILPERIKNHFKNGEITKNFIFHGNYGTGKTSLARILIGKYTKDKSHLEINSSLYTSIEVLRNEVERFCKTIPIFETKDPIKYVFLDEYEGVSQSYQDAMKALIEKYHQNVRFILTTNHLNKISDGIKSRFTILNFDSQNPEEEKKLKIEIYQKIFNIISKEENINIEKNQLTSIINKKFPDIRSIIIDVQDLKDVGESSESFSINNKLKMDLYNIIYDKNQSYESIYHFLMSRFGQDKIDIMIKMLSKDFIEWSLKDKKENIENLFKLNYIISDYSTKLESSIDPIVLGMTIIGKIREMSNT